MNKPSASWRSQHEILSIAEALKKSEFGAQYGINGIPRHLRRRTKSHNPYNHRRRPNLAKNALLQQQMEVVSEPTATTATESFTNRKMRRRPGKLAADYLMKSSWSESTIGEYIEEEENEKQLDPSTSSPPPSPPLPRRLETHLWHAKRLAMVPTWNGWVLPEDEPGPGRGTRAFACRLSTGAVIHDASYWCPVLISGRSSLLSNCLEQVLDPQVVKIINENVEKTASKGIGWEIEAMLHKFNAFPLNALAPVKIMAVPPKPAAASGGAGSNSAGAESSNEKTVSLCIWIHGAAVKEAYSALKIAFDNIKNRGDCKAEEKFRDNADGLSLSVGDARRIEIRGSKSDEKVLHALFKHIQISKSTSTSCLPHNLRTLRPQQAALVVLPDPRLTKPVALGSSTSTCLLHSKSSNKVDYDIFNHKYPLPLTEAAISQARKEARHLLVVEETLLKTNLEKATALPSVASLQGATHCTAIFIRQKGFRSSTGWSVVVPPGWVMPIWLALAFQGCRATGQREWRWLHTLDHKPFFPNDVPDSLAYTGYIQQQRENQKEEAEKRPKGKRNDHSHPVLQLDWQHLIELNDKNNDTSEFDRKSHVFVARSEFSMLKSLFGVIPTAAASTSLSCTGSGLRPVAKALASKTLQWVTRNQASISSRSIDSHGSAGGLCLVEATVTIINQGSISDEGATIFAYLKEKEEGQFLHGRQMPCYLNQNEAEEANKRYINPSDLIPIGYITSPAPQGTSGRGTASMAVVTAAAFWRLRSFQYSEYRRDKGTVDAWIRNPRSSVIYPLRLSLLVENDK